MGLFDGVKKFVDRVELSGMPADRNSKYTTVQMKQDERVKDDPLILELIDRYSGYEQILLGTESSGDLYSEFHIKDRMEMVVIFVVSKKGIIGKADARLAVTNKALYLHPDMSDTGNTAVLNRILLEDMTKYIVVSDMASGSIFFVNEAGKASVYKKSVIKSHLSMNQDIELLTGMFWFIQEKNIKNNPDAKQDREKLFQWLQNVQAGENIRINGLDVYADRLLRCMRQEDGYRGRCDLVLMKSYIYARHMEGFLEILLGFGQDSSGIEDYFISEFIVFIDRYVCELKDCTVEFSSDCLQDIDIFGGDSLFDENVYGQFSDLQRKIADVYNRKSAYMNYCIAMRYNRQLSCNEIAESCREKGLGDDFLNEMVPRCLYWNNQSMVEIFRDISSGSVPGKNCAAWRDGYGLTPLHYSLIMHNEKAVDYFLKNGRIEENVLYETDCLELMQMYGILAVFCGEERYLTRIAERSEKLKPMMESRKKLQKSIRRNMAFLKTFGTAMSFIELLEESQNRAGNEWDEEQWAEYSEKMDEGGKGYEDLVSKIECQQSELEELDEEITTIKSMIIREYYKHADDIIHEKNPVCELYATLYGKPDLIKKTLECSFDRMYHVQIYDRYLFIDSEIISREEFENSWKASGNEFENYGAEHRPGRVESVKNTVIQVDFARGRL